MDALEPTGGIYIPPSLPQHGACTGRYDLQELRKAGFSARLSDMHTDKPTLSQSHPPITLTPVAASWQQKHLSGEPSRYQVESPAHF